MSINAVIRDVMLPICNIVEQDVYEGNQLPFMVYSVYEKGDIFADDEPGTNVISITIHYFVEKDFNYLEKKKEIKRTLVDNGFLYPETEILYEEDTGYRHLVFETEREEKE